MKNILYIHSHDTGRCISPYGFPVNTPSLSRLARKGILFEQAFAVASSCSASRAALQTSEYPHQNGMTGLAHRGWSLFNYEHHLVNYLREQANYYSVLVGEHHIAPDSKIIGYDDVLTDASSRKDVIAESASNWLLKSQDKINQPWFMSCGFWETHRTSFLPANNAEDYNWPFPNLPDNEITRSDLNSLIQSVEQLDDGINQVLKSLEESGQLDNTIIIATSDHAPGFPGLKANLTDNGLGVFMIISAPDLVKNLRVKKIVSHLDIYPTLCDYLGLENPEDLPVLYLPP